MSYLIICILLTSFLYISFKSFERFGMNTFHAIVANYCVCVITGLIFTQGEALMDVFEHPKLLVGGIVLGITFISTFYAMAMVAQQISVAVSSLASKLSLVLSVSFSIFILNKNPEVFNLWNYLGIVLVLVAIFLTSHKKKESVDVSKFSLKQLAPVLAVFLLTGFIDISLNYLNKNHLEGPLTKTFPVFLFFVAALSGLIVLFVQLIKNKNKVQFKSIIGGIYLGIPNYFSIYFLLKALEAYNHNGGFVFPISNIGVILLTSLSALVLFNEKLTKFNYFGILIAILGLILMTYQEIFGT